MKVKFTWELNLSALNIIYPDFDEEKLTVSPITAACGIRDITFPRKKAIKLPRPSEDATVDAETNNGIFKKRVSYCLLKAWSYKIQIR